MDRGGGEHMDPVQLRRIVRLRNLLLAPQIHPIVRPIDARHGIRLQGHRRQRRRHLRPPLLRRRTAERTMGRTRGGGGAVLRGVLYDVAVGGGGGGEAAGGGDVFVYVSGGARTDVF